DARFPYRFTRFCIESLEPAINHRRNDLALIDRDATIHDAAANLWTNRRLVYFRIPSPSLLAGPCIDGIDDAPIRDCVDISIPEQRCSFLVASTSSDFICPGQAKPADVRGIDLLEGTVTCLSRRETVGQPFLAGLSCILQC